MPSRREVLKAGGLWLAGLALDRDIWSAEGDYATEILMRSDPGGGWVSFDPIGLVVRLGGRVRWVNAGNNVHTTTAYHPANDSHPLRIPAAAQPWDSGYLVHPGDGFEVRLTKEGIYDYFCRPHEAAGMVGRILVVREGVFHSENFIPYPEDPENSKWKKIPAAALRNFPSVKAILELGRVVARMPE